MQKSLVLKVSIVIVVQLVIWFFKIAPNGSLSNNLLQRRFSD